MDKSIFDSIRFRWNGSKKKIKASALLSEKGDSCAARFKIIRTNHWLLFSFWSEQKNAIVNVEIDFLSDRETNHCDNINRLRRL
jgi:hypothetical protein